MSGKVFHEVLRRLDGGDGAEGIREWIAKPEVREFFLRQLKEVEWGAPDKYEELKPEDERDPL